jgi:hypothetical protein
MASSAAVEVEDELVEVGLQILEPQASFRVRASLLPCRCWACF